MNNQASKILRQLLTSLAAVALISGVAAPAGLAAREKQDAKPKQHHHYKIIEMGTFGGPSSYYDTLSLSDRFPGFVYPDGFARVINKHGLMVGWADTSTPDPDPSYCLVPGYDCHVAHAFQWKNDVQTDLGSLPGGASSVALWVNSSALSVGFAQNGQADPITGFPELNAVSWNDGQISDLGTLGGNQSFAVAVNDHGQITGGAVNAVADPYSFYYLFFEGSSAGTQTRGFVWQNGVMQDIKTLGGPDAFPSLINRRGQVAGFSYINSIPNSDDGLPTYDPFLWDPKTERMTDLGNFGGDQTASVNGLNDRGEVVGGLWLPGNNQIHPFVWNRQELIDVIAPPFGGTGNGEASWINDAGEVVGLAGIPRSCPPDSAAAGPMQHAFLWQNGAMTDLGALPGSPNSEGDFINSKSQIVGISWTCNYDFTAVLWEDNSLVDLNTLVPPDSTFLLYASAITDQGEIAALGLLPDGDVRAEMLIPCDENHADIQGCDYSMVEGSTATAAGIPRVETLPTAASNNNSLTGSRNHFRSHLAHRLPGF